MHVLNERSNDSCSYILVSVRITLEDHQRINRETNSYVVFTL